MNSRCDNRAGYECLLYDEFWVGYIKNPSKSRLHFHENNGIVKMEISAQDTQHAERGMYKLLSAVVVPRPIAWVSTLSSDGVPNLAPYSFFNAVCGKPPTVLFCPGYRDTPHPKDTLTNVRETGEFVVNLVSVANADAMNVTATEVAPDVDEFGRANLTALPSRTVKPPRVGESPVQLECKLQQIVPVSEQPGGGYIVIGEVLHVHVDDAVYDAERGYIDFAAYDALGRLAGNTYTTTRERFNLIRPPSEIR